MEGVGGMLTMKDFSRKANSEHIPDFELSEESQYVLRDILTSKSKEGDGVIDLEDLGECLEAFGFEPDDEDVRFLSRHFDDNGNGTLEVEEIIGNMDVINWHSFYGKELMDQFTSIDQDKDGFIRFPEMLRMLVTKQPDPLPALEARQLLDKLARKYDENFDGKFSYAEFVKIYMSDELPYRDHLKVGTKSKSTEKKKVVKKKPSTLKKKASAVSTDDAGDATKSTLKPKTSTSGGATRVRTPNRTSKPSAATNGTSAKSTSSARTRKT
uniref:EF-hand domain-containing protein n=1 Tax=Capitella teleta TaxID=283909 RepID=X2AWD5_CAPTE